MHYQQNTPSKPQKKNRQIVFVLLCVLTGVIILFTWMKYSANKSSANQKSNDEAQTNSTKKDTNPNNTTNQTPNVPSEEIKQNVPQSNATVSIISISQADGQVKASAAISSDNGDCIFTYTIDQDKPVTRRAAGTNGVCGVSTPEVEFSRLGLWNLNVTAYIDGKKTEANQSVTIK